MHGGKLNFYVFLIESQFEFATPNCLIGIRGLIFDWIQITRADQLGAKLMERWRSREGEGRRENYNRTLFITSTNLSRASSLSSRIYFLFINFKTVCSSNKNSQMFFPPFFWCFFRVSFLSLLLSTRRNLFFASSAWTITRNCRLIRGNIFLLCWASTWTQSRTKRQLSSRTIYTKIFSHPRWQFELIFSRISYRLFLTALPQQQQKKENQFVNSSIFITLRLCTAGKKCWI